MRHPKCNGEMLVIYSSNAVFWGDNNLLASLKSRWLLEEIALILRSFIIRV